MGNLQSETTPQGTVSYTWHVDNLVDTIQATGLDNVTHSWTFHASNAFRVSSIGGLSMTYDAAGRLSTKTFPNGVIECFGYYPASEVKKLSWFATGGSCATDNSGNGTGTSLGSLAYTYDLAGRVATVTPTGSLSGVVLPAASNTLNSASYDAANGLTAWTAPGGGLTPRYDGNGAMLCDNWNAGTSSCTGNAYAWDGRRRLSSSSSGGTATGAYVYDGLDRR